MGGYDKLYSVGVQAPTELKRSARMRTDSVRNLSAKADPNPARKNRKRVLTGKHMEEMMNKTVKTILISGIYVLGYWVGYWGCVFIIGGIPSRVMDCIFSLFGGLVDLLSASLSASYPVIYAVFAVIVFYRRKCFEKIIHVIIFALISILVNIVILYSIPVIGDDIWIVLYFFYSSIIATIISVVVYLIIYIGARYKHEGKGLP